MALTFGTRLRLRREEQQIPLATIAEQTKISVSLLEALERDDVSRWPKGIFRRSYLRDYASAIGLEPDTALREFQGLYPDPDEHDDVGEVLAHAHNIPGYQAPARRPPTRLRCLIDSAVSALPALNLPPVARNGFRAERLARPMEVRLPQLPTPYVPSSEIEPAPDVAHAHDVVHALDVAHALDAEPAAEAAPTSEATPAPAVAAVAVAVAHDEPGVDLSEVAQLCTRLACALDVCDITPVLDQAVRVLRAAGLIVWVRDSVGRALSPVFVHGYSRALSAHLAPVAWDADNALARAFNAAEMQVVEGDDFATGAVVVPLLTPTGCAGVLALELKHRVERLECVRAAATILAAQLSTLLGAPVLTAASA